MVSYSLDYLFNRVYDFLLWIKYTWLFTILHTKPEDYLKLQESYDWDGLRDRGWFDAYFAAKNAPVPPVQEHVSLWHRMLEKVGISPHENVVPDPAHDPSINHHLPYDLQYCISEYKNQLTSAEIKERYEADYTLSDTIRDIFGVAPRDEDKDNVPDSYEMLHNLNKSDTDSDHDNLPDGVEICYGTDALNNDTDRDGVIDGRDEAPLDNMVSASSIDSDGDGVSDDMEKLFAMNPQDKDTDHDGISDAMDTYPLDPNNLNPVPLLDISRQAEAFQWHIQNPLLGLLAKMFSVMAIFGLVLFVMFFLWFIYAYWSAQLHYEHHFNDSHGPEHEGHADARPSLTSGGFPELPVGEYVAPHQPTNEEFEQHPRWAIIEGYMASPTEALWRIGIIEADTMLAEVLRSKGYEGADVGEMLGNASFKTVQLAWDAHKIRNRIAHDGSSFTLTEREAKRAYALYEAVFKELKAI